MWQSTDGIFLGQGKYAVEILKRFKMMDCMTTPMASNMKLLIDASSETIDATMCWLLDVPETRYLLCCEHIETRSPNGCKACRSIVEYRLKYDMNQKINLEGYVDSDWAGSAIDRKSTSRCCFSMGSGVISWISRKQSCVALSTAEAKYVASCSTS